MVVFLDESHDVGDAIMSNAQRVIVGGKSC